MPKRHGNLYEKSFTLETLYAAYLRARRTKRKTLSVRKFERDLGANLSRLVSELHEGTYRPEPYRHFTVYGSKPRQISAPSFRDVVVQHAIYAAISPIFEAAFTDDSYGCRIGGGAHRASDSLQLAMRRSGAGSYVLQMDVRKFYYSIDHTILRGLIERKIKDVRFVDLMMVFASDNGAAVGLPIGNLLSQIYALIYLNPLDHYVKRKMKLRHYARYVDDFVMVFGDRQSAIQAKVEIEALLMETLKLTLSKWSVSPVSRGVNFVGFRTWRSRRFVRRRSLHGFSRALRIRKIDSLVSIVGCAMATSTIYHFMRRLSDEGVRDMLPAKMRCSYDLLLQPKRGAWTIRGKRSVP